MSGDDKLIAEIKADAEDIEGYAHQLALFRENIKDNPALRTFLNGSGSVNSVKYQVNKLIKALPQIFSYLGIKGYDFRNGDVITALEKLNTAIPLKKKGILPSGINIEDIRTIKDALKAYDQKTPDYEFIKDLVLRVAMQSDELRPYLIGKTEEDIHNAIRKVEKTLKNVKIRLAHTYIDTVKLIDRSSEGKGFEIWVPLNRLENSYSNDKDGKGQYGFKLRSFSAVEARHEVWGHLLGYYLDIPLGESREAAWGVNPTELFATTFSNLDILNKILTKKKISLPLTMFPIFIL